jgi:hypothetical protein
MDGSNFPDTSRAELLEPEIIPAVEAVPSRADQFDDADFAVVMLQALTRMAARSRRRQADVTAALRGADIVAEPARVQLALERLLEQGAISNLVPLSDGGLLLSVPHQPSEHRGLAPRWQPPDLLDPAT